jgi:5-formyltetrahydrofolate cyclo-ligase
LTGSAASAGKVVTASAASTPAPRSEDISKEESDKDFMDVPEVAVDKNKGRLQASAATPT